MKKSLLILIGFCFLFAGCGGDGGPGADFLLPHKFKITPNQFRSEGSISLQDPTIVEVCFTFNEVGPVYRDYPLYIIPPEKGGVHWVLTGKDGEFVSPCELKAYKMNPDDEELDERERGDLVKVDFNQPYCKEIDLSILLEGQEVPSGEYEFKAIYSWERLDPELVGGYCPYGANCYTIFQGEVAEQRLTIMNLPHIP